MSCMSAGGPVEEQWCIATERARSATGKACTMQLVGTNMRQSSALLLAEAAAPFLFSMVERGRHSGFPLLIFATSGQQATPVFPSLSARGQEMALLRTHCCSKSRNSWRNGAETGCLLGQGKQTESSVSLPSALKGQWSPWTMTPQTTSDAKLNLNNC